MLGDKDKNDVSRLKEFIIIIIIAIIAFIINIIIYINITRFLVCFDETKDSLK